jgi:hypothetical protein
MKISCQEYRQDIAALNELRVFVITYLSYKIVPSKGCTKQDKYLNINNHKRAVTVIFKRQNE